MTPTKYVDLTEMRSPIWIGGEYIDWKGIGRIVLSKPDTWFLASRGQSRQHYTPEGIVRFITSVHVRGGVNYYRTYLKAEGTEPSQLAYEQENLPRVQPWDLLEADYYDLVKLPKLDMTDGGFCWTKKELDDATVVARNLLFEGIPIPKRGL